MNKDFIWEVGEYIAAGHKISEAALKFNKSNSSIKKYLAKIRNINDECYNKILAEKINLAQAKIELEGQRKGGRLGKRGKTLEEWQIKMLLEGFLHSGKTLLSFADMVKIPKSTLYDAFSSIQDEELKKSFREHMERYIHSNDIDKSFDMEENVWKR